MAHEPRVIRGKVRDAAGNPVAGARVFFTSGPAAFADVAALTDAEGSFALSAPAPGTYELEFHSETFGRASASVTVPAEGGPEVEIQMG